MSNTFKTVCDEIVEELNHIEYEGDLSDVGNHIGGLNHGISITDGTHP